MSIQGAIEDFPLKDILQIIAFSRKSGTLRIEGEAGLGQILFRSGSIVQASAPAGYIDFGTLVVQMGFTTDEAVKSAAEAQRARPVEERRPLGQTLISAGAIPASAVESVVRQQIALALRELVSWKAGSFTFDVHKVAAHDSFGVGVQEMALDHGLDVQRLLLEAMKFFDDRARAGAEAATGAMPAPPPPTPEPPPPSSDSTMADAPASEGPPLALVVRHDEGLFRDILLQRLAAEEMATDVAETVDHAMELAQLLREGRSMPVIVAELEGSQDEEPIWGLGVLKALRDAELEVPVILLADRQAEETKGQAFHLGARHILFRPEREGDDQDYLRRVEEFAVEVAFEVKALCSEEAFAGGADLPGEEASDPAGEGIPAELREMLAELRSEDAATMLIKLLQIVGQRFPRAILMQVKAGELAVRGAYGRTSRGTEVGRLLRSMTFDPRQYPGFEAAFQTAEPRRLAVGPDVGQIPDLIGPPASMECLAIPILCHFRPVALIYADSGDSGQPLPDLEIYRGLCNRASEILEEAVLRRKGQKFLHNEPPTGAFPRSALR